MHYYFIFKLRESALDNDEDDVTIKLSNDLLNDRIGENLKPFERLVNNIP